MPELVTDLVPADGASVGVRVERLLAWGPVPAHSAWASWWVLLAATATLLNAQYARALERIHELTELLLR